MARKEIAVRRKGLFGASLAVFAAATAGAAYAQDAVSEEEIVVTGFRGALAAAIDQKRAAVGSIDSIVAEDIAKFPDLNLSEAIQRVPGVAITRAGGEGRQIAVRGLGAQFTRVRINGLEALATVGSTDAAGGTNRGRNFDFNTFASELFNNITIRKTASADTEEGSLGATVDLRTARPFDYSGFEMAISGQAGYNDLSQEYDPRAAFLISNRSEDGRFGALFSIAYSNRSLLEEGASTVRWQNDSTNPATGLGTSAASRFGTVLGVNCLGATQNANCTAVNRAFHPRIPRYDIYQHESDRVGATLSLQWRPSDATELTLDVLYSKLDATRTEIFLESPVFSATGAANINNTDVLDFEIQGNSLVYGRFDDVDIRAEARFDELATEFNQVNLEGTHRFSDSFRVHGLVGRSLSEHDNPVQTTLLFDRFDVDGYVYDYRTDNRLPVITYGATNLTAPASWFLSQIRLRPQTANNEYSTAQGDFTWDLTPSFSLIGGVNWKKYEFTTTELRRSNGTTANLEAVIPANVASTSLANYSQIATFSGRGLSVPSANPTSWLIPDFNAAASLFNLYDTSVFRMGSEPALGNNNAVAEESMGAFLQASWDTELGGMGFRGNIGVRYVETDQTASGYTFTSGRPLLVNVERTYDDALPSLNLSLEPVENFLVRFSAAKVMTRPGLGNLTPGAAVAVSGNNRTVTAGNPELEPFRADAYDLSFEWYFAEDSLLSLALFHKELGSFVQNVRETRPFTGNPLGLPDVVATAACPGGVNTSACNPTVDWQFTVPRNTSGGPVKGYEVNLQVPFSFLPDVWSNFGLLANYTHVESEIDYVDAAGAVVLQGASLVGQSETSYNLTFFYEDERFSARVSGAYRSDYPTTLPGRNLNDTEDTAETLNVDASFNWTFNDHLSFTLEGLNLTDEVDDQLLNPDDRSSFYHHFGRQYFLGFRYTY